MSNRENLPEWIARYNEGNLDGEELAAFLGMLESNPSLKKEVKLDKELNNELADEDILDLRKKIMTARMSGNGNNYLKRNVLLLAASLAALLTLEVVINHLCSRQDVTDKFTQSDRANPKEKGGHDSILKHPERTLISEKEKVTDNKPLTRIRPDKLVLAANFQPNPALEGLVGNTTRSDYFKMRSPVGEQCFFSGDKIRFVWEYASDKTLKFMIVDNTGYVVFESESVTGNTIMVNGSQLNKGLYYFKVIRNDDLIYFGKFFVK